jgi:predicted NBD/HSP70 family sugar kinase
VESVSASPATSRESNRDRIVDALRRLGVASRAELARATGLSRSTVSSIVASLRRSGLIADYDGAPRAGSRSGRPPELITLRRSAGAAVGIDLGKRHLAVAVADLAHTLLAERRRELDDGHAADEALDAAVELVGEVLAEAGVEREKALGVGMGVPGPIHQPSGTVGPAAILPGWAGVRVAEALARRIELPVWVENDANLGALAELTWGAGRGCDHLAYLKLATGIGAGIVIGGRLYRGAGGTAGEIGHTAIEERGALCRCGNRGCLETLAGAPAIAALVARALGEEVTPEAVLARAAEGDPVCARALADAGRVVGIAVANLCNLTNPQRIVVGGTIGGAGEVLLSPLRDSVRLRAIGSAAADVEIVPGKLGQRAELLGAVALVLHQASPVQGARGYTAVSTA